MAAYSLAILGTQDAAHSVRSKHHLVGPQAEGKEPARSRLRPAVAQRPGLLVGRVAGTCQDRWSVPSRPNPSLSRVFRSRQPAHAQGRAGDDELIIGWAGVGDLCGSEHKPD